MKVVTLRLSDQEYKLISTSAEIDRRPISNFITARVIKHIEESFGADAIEMAQIQADKKLLGKLKAGHKDAQKMKGKFIE